MMMNPGYRPIEYDATNHPPHAPISGMDVVRQVCQRWRDMEGVPARQIAHNNLMTLPEAIFHKEHARRQFLELHKMFAPDA